MIREDHKIWLELFRFVLVSCRTKGPFELFCFIVF